MTFPADRPFFPYSEPEDQRGRAGGPRLLRVFFLGDQKMAGALSDGTRWPGEVVWANALGAAARSNVLSKLDLGPGEVPGGAWLTVFEDRASPRPGTGDLHFSASPDPSTVERGPVVNETMIDPCLLGPVALLLLGALLLVRRVLRRPAAPRAQRAPEG
jgi:hypothetical protein